MEATEIRKLAALEDTHWWYRERRALLTRALRQLAARGGKPGRALDIGAAGGGNTRVLRAHGWRPVALEYSEDGARVAAERGLDTMRADARLLPVQA
ncbi:MAG TPA: methyltransferase domain-containing protein, partial [Micromonosporaceae bacterium]|nr:methyltransferase domain-containing protein [Micromonosporaceae bacterium]